MEWFYADGQEKRGPFSDAQAQELIAAGKIAPGTLVWNATLTEWKPARDSALFGAIAADATAQRCIIVGQVFPVSQMIKTQHGWVSAKGKERYYQSLRENAPIPVAEGVTNARRDGKKFVIPVTGGQLPLRCVKTGQPVQTSELKKKTLYWCTPWAALSILLNVLIYLILYLVMRKKVALEIPLSPAGKAVIRKHGFIAAGIALGGIALAVIGGYNVDANGAYGWLIFVGALLIVAGLVYASFKANALRVTKVADGEAWLTGAGPDFLAQLPEY